MNTNFFQMDKIDKEQTHLFSDNMMADRDEYSKEKWHRIKWIKWWERVILNSGSVGGASCEWQVNRVPAEVREPATQEDIPERAAAGAHSRSECGVLEKWNMARVAGSGWMKGKLVGNKGRGQAGFWVCRPYVQELSGQVAHIDRGGMESREDRDPIS